MAIDNQTIIRTNRDTLYSLVVFDLEAGTVTLPDAGDRFMSMQLIDEDMYSPATIYEPGTHRTDWHEVHNPRGAHVGGSE